MLLVKNKLDLYPMKVCIAEKPSVARDIAYIIGAKSRKDGYFEGNGYQVTWTFGHLCTLKTPDDYKAEWKRWDMAFLPMLPEKFGIKLIGNKGVKKQFGIIKKLVNSATEVINCGDAGQEGELIQRWVLLHAKCRKPVKRLWISSLTPEAIRAGFQQLKDARAYDHLYDAGRSRAIGDWLLGMNATRLFTLKYGGYKQVLSIGRVQTPTLAMIVKRHHTIQNFKPQTYWELHTIYREVKFASDKSKFDKKEDGQKWLEQVKGQPFTILSVTAKKGRETPPRLFDLTSLQIQANKQLGMSADNTLKTIQSLYEKKLVTYPRVDTTYLPDDMYPKISGIMQKLNGYEQFTQPLLQKPIRKTSKIFNNKKVTDHHAILPTGVAPKSLNNYEQKLYDIITRRFIAAFYPDCIVNNTTVIGEAGGVKFKVTGKQILEPGWRVLYPQKKKKGADNSNTNQTGNKNTDKNKSKEQTPLPAFKKGENGPHQPELLEKQTQPPKNYSEATLLRAMETAGKTVDDEELRDLMKANGIGRPSTRANIIETLFKRRYIQRIKKAIIPTQTGIDLIGTIQNDLLKSAELTGQWEQKLRSIEQNKYNADVFIGEMKTMVNTIVEEVIHSKLKARISATPTDGKSREGKFAKGKSGHVASKKVRKTNISKSNLTDSKSTKKLSTGKQDKVQAGQVSCPKCNKGIILKGKKAYGCSKYAGGCNFIVPFIFHGKKISDNQVLKLITRGKTQKLKGFTLNDKKVDGYIWRQEDGSLKLVIEDKENNSPNLKTKKPIAKKAAAPMPLCPKCKTGRILKGNTAYGCTRWQSGCDFRFSFEKIYQQANGRKLTKDLVLSIISH